MSPAQTVEVPLGAGTDCTACAERIEEGLRNHRGIEAVRAAPSGTSLEVSYDPDLCGLRCLTEAATELQIELGDRFAHEVLEIGGMDCADCAQTIERAVSRVPGVSHAAVSFAAARMSLELESGEAALPDVAARVRGLGYQVADPSDGEQPSADPWWRSRNATTSLSGLFLLIGLAAELLFPDARAAAIAAYAAAILIGGIPVARSGIAALRATLRPDINLLMTIAVVGAAAIGAWVEASLVVVLFSLGEALESRAVDRARRELAGLVSLAPEFARVRRARSRGDEQQIEEVTTPVAELSIGDLVVVRPGERIPADGTIAEGASAIDQAPITGESTPVDRAAGEAVFAGTLNVQGLLVIRVDRAPGDTTLDRIGRLVAEAQSRKSPSERWVSAFARVYTPLVIVAAVLVATVPLAFGVAFSDSIYSALALLILACPCALVVSTPVSIVSALGRASAAGVLVKGGEHLERAATIRRVAFDKTGTLTAGTPRLVSVVSLGDVAENDLLALAASLEQGSEHPLARAVIAAARERGLQLAEPEGFEALAGMGARGNVGGAEIAVGNARLFEGASLEGDTGATLHGLQQQGQTAAIVARDGLPIGILGLADRPRPEAIEAIADLKRLDIERTVMLTGDNRATAEAIAAELGVTDVRAELLPEDKVAALEEFGPGSAMVGDGVNDAPALAAAELGIAMGSAGSDTAIEVADVALMGDEPRKVAGLIGLARWSRAVVRQNIAFSLATKAVAVGFLAAGALPLWAAVASDVGASLIVVANGLRLLRGTPGGRMRGLPLLEPAGRRGPAKGESAGPAPELAAPTALPVLASNGKGALATDGGCTDDACCVDDQEPTKTTEGAR